MGQRLQSGTKSVVFDLKTTYSGVVLAADSISEKLFLVRSKFVGLSEKCPHFTVISISSQNVDHMAIRNDSYASFFALYKNQQEFLIFTYSICHFVPDAAVRPQPQWVRDCKVGQSQ